MGKLNEFSEKLSEYVGFNIDYLWSLGDPVIFGGCLRDIIADQSINDVDILCGKITMYKIEIFLLRSGYKFMDKFKNIDLVKMYHDINTIHEPVTYKNKKGRIVQLIKPRINTYQIEKKLFDDTKENFHMYNETIRNYYYSKLLEFAGKVDLTCCGLLYLPKTLLEGCPNAILHCKNKVFHINESSEMTTSRIKKRIQKMINRGWTQIEECENRNLIIDDIIFTSEEEEEDDEPDNNDDLPF